IRDWSVTGVQTCALPISAAVVPAPDALVRPRLAAVAAARLAAADGVHDVRAGVGGVGVGGEVARTAGPFVLVLSGPRPHLRAEEIGRAAWRGRAWGGGGG